MKRRSFLTSILPGIGGVYLQAKAGELAGGQDSGAPLFQISLAQWSLHRALRGGELDNLEFAPFARQEFGIDAVEYVNRFFKDRAEDTNYLNQMKRRARESGVRSLLIMCDGEGRLGDPSDKKRTQSVENHYKWVEVAAFLGCHSIRVNAASEGSYEEQMKLASDGLRRLTEFASDRGIYVLVENHGGLSSNGAWLSGVLDRVSHPRCGILPDFGNFRISGEERYDPYKGVTELMPYARAVSAKSYDFDETGNETTIDYRRMMEIVVGSGYHGYVGIEYEGDRLSEVEGILATQRLLVAVRKELAQESR